jgi:cobalamin biosynthesis Mg chelatase CobN
MKTTGQSEKLRGATAQEEQRSDAEEEQTTPSPEVEEQKEQETPSEAENPSTDVSSEPETAKAEDAIAPEASVAPRKKRAKKKAEEPFDEKAASPRPSYWPIVLAFSLCVMSLGVAWHPVMMGIGVVMVITSLIAWSLERR